MRVLIDTNIFIYRENYHILPRKVQDLLRYGVQVAWSKKVARKLEEGVEREIGKERYREIKRESEERFKGHKPARIYWTKKDMTDMIDILRRRLVDMRRKVSRDFHK